MDTTKIYVAMAEKSEEIQKLRTYNNPVDPNNYEPGDFYIASSAMDSAVKNLRVCGSGGMIPFDRPVFWMPRQDQLQEIIVGDSNFSPTYHAKFKQFVNNDPWARAIQYERAITYEQLWLAFVMKEKYNKVWNGSTWG